MEFEWLSWSKGAEMCEELAEMVKEVNPDILVGVSRGGLVPVRILSDKLAINKLGILGIQFYKKVGETKDFPEITHDMPLKIDGKRILIVDDVADTGKSLVAAKDYISRRGAAEIKTATLHYKPTSIIKPDYFVGVTTAWIVYPWEQYEVKREIKKK